MLLYHGSNTVVESPDVSHSRDNLDFGKGFYLTSHFEQAKNWAIRKKRFEKGEPLVNVYEIDEDVFVNYSIRRFEVENKEWLEYVASNRNGVMQSDEFDAVFGPVANDRVFEAITMYLDELWDADTTLRALKYYKLNDQWCFKNQELIDNRLNFLKVRALDR